ncbi:MAG: SDR family oxidoreductase [Bacilli bacterium]|nr:SDR family oxidoreductase [Bacilli bacterium]
MINPMSLQGKIVLVTGASAGIGKATAIQLSKLGAKLILVARNRERLEETLNSLEGKDHAFYSFDLSHISSIEEFAKNVTKNHGSLSGLVHSAGISKARPLTLLKNINLNEIMTINFYSFIEIVRCFSKKKSFCDGGSIVAVSSISSIKGYKSKTAYNASKAALDSSIRCIAGELANKRIRINSVMPGWVATEMLERFSDRTAGIQEGEDTVSKQFLGLVEPIEVANLIAFLLSDATKTITGTSVLIDGGLLQN